MTREQHSLKKQNDMLAVLPPAGEAVAVVVEDVAAVADIAAVVEDTGSDHGDSTVTGMNKIVLYYCKQAHLLIGND